MHMEKEKSYLLIISQAGKVSWWYILRFYVCITWLSTILAVVIGDENIFLNWNKATKFQKPFSRREKNQAKPRKTEKKA